MTPAAQRPTGARIDPTVTLTTPNGAQVLPLKFKATTIHDDAQSSLAALIISALGTFVG